MAAFHQALSEGQPPLKALGTTTRRLELPAGQVLAAVRRWNAEHHPHPTEDT